MPLITTRWVHGNIVQAENPVEVVIRRGWGTHFGVRNPTENWFHFPITTLSSVNNLPIRLLKVFVFYRTDGAVVKDIHIYDGPLSIRSFEGLNLTGDHSGRIDGSNCWDIHPPAQISQGLGISVNVEFLQNTGIGMSEILFTTAGAEFESPF
jgi:hypothetical protein